jgi:hypothetical protein
VFDQMAHPQRVDRGPDPFDDERIAVAQRSPVVVRTRDRDQVELVEQSPVVVPRREFGNRVHPDDENGVRRRRLLA